MYDVNSVETRNLYYVSRRFFFLLIINEKLSSITWLRVDR